MLKIKFLKDYTALGKLQFPAGKEFEVQDSMQTVIPMADKHFLGMYDLYDLKRKGFVEITTLGENE